MLLHDDFPMLHEQGIATRKYVAGETKLVDDKLNKTNGEVLEIVKELTDEVHPKIAANTDSFNGKLNVNLNNVATDMLPVVTTETHRGLLAVRDNSGQVNVLPVSELGIPTAHWETIFDVFENSQSPPIAEFPTQDNYVDALRTSAIGGNGYSFRI